jgi:hypothetical protein
VDFTDQDNTRVSQSTSSQSQGNCGRARSVAQGIRHQSIARQLVLEGGRVKRLHKETVHVQAAIDQEFEVIEHEVRR